MKEISIITSHLFRVSSDGSYAISGGGLERYIWELCETLQEMGMKVSVHQLTSQGSFHKRVGTIEIIGYQVNEQGTVHQLVQISEGVELTGGLMIYAGIETLGRSFPYQPGSIGICYNRPSDQGDAVECSTVQDDTGTFVSTYDQLQQVVAVNSLVLGWMHNDYHDSERSQGIVIRQTMDTTKFRPVLHWSEPKHSLRIVFPRLLEQGREVINTLLMIDRILLDYPEVIVEFANDSEEENVFTYAFRLWMRDHPYKDRLVYEKYAFRKMVDAYRKANIVVIPSFFKEGSAYTCLEAMSCGIPVIAGNRGGINDVMVDGYDGLIVEPNEESLFSGIRRLLDHSDIRRYLGSNARRTASSFDQKVWKWQWMKLFKDISETHIGSNEKRPED